MPRKSKINSIDTEDLRKIIDENHSLSDVLRRLGVKGGGVFDTLKKRCEKDGIDLSGLRERHRRWEKERLWRMNPGVKSAFPLEDVMVKNSTYPRGTLKSRLLRNGMLKETCVKCGLGAEWEKEPLVLVLDHINGINNDHRFENLRLLCPNCNSQTSTFAGRNGKRTKAEYFCDECKIPITRSSRSGLCLSCCNRKRRGGNLPTEVCKSCNGPANKKSLSGLCRSCYNQTKNRKVQNRPPKEGLKEMMDTMPMTHIGKKFGVSDNAVRKWARGYDLID